MKNLTKLMQQIKLKTFEGHTPARKPSTRKLDAFEKRSKLALPPSYRQFILQFGPGELGCFLRIKAPGYKGDANLDLAELNADLHGSDELLKEKFGDHSDLFDCLYCFGTTFGGDVLGWDTRRRNKEGEYRVIGIPRYEDEITKLAPTFGDLVAQILGGKVKRPIGAIQSELREERFLFTPHYSV